MVWGREGQDRADRKYSGRDEDCDVYLQCSKIEGEVRNDGERERGGGGLEKRYAIYAYVDK